MSEWIKHVKIGTRVVCINDTWPEYALTSDEIGVIPAPVRVPMINEVLTISAIKGGRREHTKHLVWLSFEEINLGWDARHFRPLVDRPTDIGVFEKLLNTAPEQISEDA